MNIQATGHKQWLIEFHTAVKRFISKPLPPKLVERLADDLTDEWFRGTPPQQAARDILVRLLPLSETEVSIPVEARRVA